jgi:hypothetical protein
MGQATTFPPDPHRLLELSPGGANDRQTKFREGCLAMFAAHSKTHVNHNEISHPEIETLEGRRLLSADLTAAFASQLPAEFKPGNNANRVAVEVFNHGDSTASGKVAVDLYAQGVSGQSNVLLGEVSRNVNLRAQRGGIFNFRFGEPLGLVDGNYDLVAQISTSAVNDAVTSNDIVTSTAPVAFARPFADVTTTAVKAPAQSIVLQTRETQQWGSVTLENLGNATAQGKVSITFYLSPKTILDGDAVQAETMVVSINLKAGQAKTFRAKLGAPANALGGSYYLFAVTNPINGNVPSLQGHGVGIAVNQVRVTVVSKVVIFPLRTICYSGPDYQCTPGEVGGVECTEERVVDPTPVDPTPVDPTPVDPTPVDPTPVDPAPIDPPPADPAPVDPTPVDGSGDSGTTDSGSSDDGSNDNGSTDDGSTDNGSTDDGSTDAGSTDDGSTYDGSTDDGSTDSGSTDDGSGDDGSGGDYAEEDFIARRSTKSVSASVHPVSHAMPSAHVHVAGQRAAERPVSRGRR